MYSVRLLESAEHELAKLDHEIGARIARRICWLSQNIEAIRPLALKGELYGLFKLCEGDYRILYQILREEDTIIVHAIGHRRDVCRKRK